MEAEHDAALKSRAAPRSALQALVDMVGSDGWQETDEVGLNQCRLTPG